MKIAIIGGSGRMGQWFARFLLREGHEIMLSGRNPEKLAAAGAQLGVRTGTNTEIVKGADIIFLSVPLEIFEEVVREISPFVSPGQVVIDNTSIKEYPVEVMHRCLGSATVLGSHPLFGPGARDLTGQNFILTPTNENETLLAQQVCRYLESHGARVSLMSPVEHDRMMSVVLGMAHFISIVAADFLAEAGDLSKMKAVGGSTYRVLLTLVESVISEDPELYASLQMRLPGLAEMENRFQQKAAGWAEMVRNQDKQLFVKKMTELKKVFADNNSNFGQAYRNMYQIIEWL